MRIALGLAFVLGAALAAGCGDPGGASEFTFDPIPVATIGGFNSPWDGTLVSVDAECYAFAADRISVYVDADEVDGLLQRVGRVGFTGVDEYPIPGDGATFITLAVPSGSVPDAMEYVRAQRGVRSVNRVAPWDTGPPEELPRKLVACPTPEATGS